MNLKAGDRILIKPDKMPVDWPSAKEAAVVRYINVDSVEVYGSSNGDVTIPFDSIGKVLEPIRDEDVVRLIPFISGEERPYKNCDYGRDAENLSSPDKIYYVTRDPDDDWEVKLTEGEEEIDIWIFIGWLRKIGEPISLEEEKIKLQEVAGNLLLLL